MSATAAVTARNAANAQHSTGPVTDEGKARSAQNALRHGLSGRTVLLPHENREQYESLRESFLAEHQPSGQLEIELVCHMVDCWWRLQRAHRVETEFLQQRADAITEANPGLEGDAALACMFSDGAESKSFRLFMRYLTNAQNAWRHACAEFQKVRRERLAREDEEAMLAVMMQEHISSPGGAQPNGPTPAAPATSGFVSHSALHPASPANSLTGATALHAPDSRTITGIAA